MEIKNEVNKELECPICMEIFKKPKLLSCRHTFCEECLVKIAANKNDISCPTCRAKTEIPKDGVVNLYTNYIAKDVVEKLQFSGKKLKCHDCVEKATAVSHCRHCRINLCKGCLEYHRKSIKFSAHSIIDVSDAPKSAMSGDRYCSKHKELLKYFCQLCEQSVCNDCTMSEQHRQHQQQIVLLDELRSKMKKEVEDLVKKGTDYREVVEETVNSAKEFMKAVEKEKEESINIIKTLFAELHERLETRELELIQTLNKRTDVEKSNFVQLEMKEKRFTDLLNYSKSILEEELDADIKVFEELKSQFQGCFHDLGEDQKGLNPRLRVTENPPPPPTGSYNKSIFTSLKKSLRVIMGNRFYFCHWKTEVNSASKKVLTDQIDGALQL